MRDPQPETGDPRPVGEAPVPGVHAQSAVDAEQSRAILDALLGAVPFGLAFLDTDLRYVLVNQRLADMDGNTVEHLLSRPRDELMGADLAARTRPLVHQVLDTGEPATVRATTRLPSDPDRERSFELTYFAVDADGRRVGVAAVARDITEEVQADRERAALQAELEQVRRLETVGQLAGGVAHDFNNLLAVIGLRSELLRRRHPEMADLVDNLLTVERAVAQGRDLARRLLTFSRRQHVVPQLIDLDAVVQGLAGLARSLAGDGVDLRLEPGAPDAHVLIDPGAVEQVVLNLVVNARDALAEGGTVVVSTSVPDDGGSTTVELVVADDGVGMPPDVARHAFEPFFTTKATGLGTGLGLSTVYGVVTGAGGSVDLESAPGEGTRVRVRLPLADPVSGRPVMDTDLVLPPGEQRLVLVVDDELDITRVVGEALVGAGYEVVVAGSGHSARSLVDDRVEDLDLVVTDVLMPGGTGPELARALHEVRPDLPVVFMSGFAGSAEGAPTLPPGTTLLRKPFTIDELLTTVARALASRR